MVHMVRRIPNVVNIPRSNNNKGPAGWNFTWAEWNRWRRRFDGCAFCGGPQQVICPVVGWRWSARADEGSIGNRNIGNALPSCETCRREKRGRHLVVWAREKAKYVDVLTLSPAEFAIKHGLTKEHDRFLRRTRAVHDAFRDRARRSRELSYRQYAVLSRETVSTADDVLVVRRLPLPRRGA